MKVLLVNPRGLNLYAKLKSGLPPLGLAYLASVIREAGHQVAIIDGDVEFGSLSVEDFGPYDLVGISADTPRYPKALKVAAQAKQAGKKVVMGGYHVTFLDKEALETGLVDIVVRGEAEETIVELLRALENDEDLRKVRGISFLEDGQFVRTPQAPPPRNLDALPFPARDLLFMDRYNGELAGIPITNLITSRGCPFDCYFCASSRFGGLRWRYRSAKSMVDELEMLYYDYGYRAFAFMDDNFTLNKGRVMEFADELERRHLTDIIFWCFSRADILARNEDMVQRMAEVGAFQVFLGLESHSKETLDAYGKKLKNEDQDRAIALLRKYGITIDASFILGNIDETKEMALETARWAQELNPYTVQFSLLTPYPGTALYHDMEEQGRFLHKDWELFDGLHAVIRTEGMTPDEAERVLMTAYRMAYLNKARLLHPWEPSPELARKLERLRVHRNGVQRAFDILGPVEFFGKMLFEQQITSFKRHTLARLKGPQRAFS